jgi:hypothetical protein
MDEDRRSRDQFMQMFLMAVEAGVSSFQNMNDNNNNNANNNNFNNENDNIHKSHWNSLETIVLEEKVFTKN